VIELRRRSLLIASAAVLAAPAIVRAALLMPVRPLRLEPGLLSLDWGAGDDWFACEFWLKSKAPGAVWEKVSTDAACFKRVGDVKLVLPGGQFAFAGAMDEFRITKRSS
jgi:hypothetical protein